MKRPGTSSTMQSRLLDALDEQKELTRIAEVRAAAAERAVERLVRRAFPGGGLLPRSYDRRCTRENRQALRAWAYSKRRYSR